MRPKNPLVDLVSGPVDLGRLRRAETEAAEHAGDRAKRACRPRAERPAARGRPARERLRPAQQGRPSLSGGCRAPVNVRTHDLANGIRRSIRDAPQRQREENRGRRVPPVRHNPARSDTHDGGAVVASVAPQLELDVLGIGALPKDPAKPPGHHPVSLDPSAASVERGGTTARTQLRPNLSDAWRPREPELDVGTDL